VKWADAASPSQQMGNRGRKQLKVTAEVVEERQWTKKMNLRHGTTTKKLKMLL